MRCPVCPNPDVPADQTACPNCGTDLSPIRRVQELPARWYNEALALLQRGDNAAAIAKLCAAAELDPQSEPVKQLLAKTRVSAEPKRENHGVAIAAFAILALIAIGALIMAIRRPAETRVVQSSVAASPRTTSPAPSRPDPEPAKPALNDLASRLAQRTDVRVDREGDDLKITFHGGLFPSGSDVMTKAGRVRLESIARELTNVRVNVEGFTDSNPPPPHRWKDNWALAFSRAHAAVEAMRATGADVTWTSSSSGDADPPYAEKEKNRTVVLHIAAR